MGILSTLINVVIASGFIASLGWVLFAASVPQDGDGRPGGELVKNDGFRPRRSPAPIVKPSNRELRALRACGAHDDVPSRPIAGRRHRT